jgi:hypothetical protein
MPSPRSRSATVWDNTPRPRAWNPSRVRIAGAQYTQQSALWDVSTRTTANQDLVYGGFGS